MQQPDLALLWLALYAGKEAFALADNGDCVVAQTQRASYYASHEKVPH